MTTFVFTKTLTLKYLSMATTKVIGVTGIEYEVCELTGQHQAVMTKGGGKNMAKKLGELFKMVVKSAGILKNPSDEDLLKIPSADRKLILLTTRNFSLDYDPNFRFEYSYRSDEGKQITTEMEVTISTDYDIKPYINNKGEVIQVKDLNELDLEIETILPKSKKIVRYKMLDGVGELKASTIKESDIDSNTPLYIRNLREITKGADGSDLPLVIRGESLSLRDIEHIRRSIKEHEGYVDSTFVIEHPETGEEIKMDLLAQVGFMFPSGAI